MKIELKANSSDKITIDKGCPGCTCLTFKAADQECITHFTVDSKELLEAAKVIAELNKPKR